MQGLSLANWFCSSVIFICSFCFLCNASEEVVRTEAHTLPTAALQSVAHDHGVTLSIEALPAMPRSRVRSQDPQPPRTKNQ
eukprot:6197155-Amphidinium_carterae.1